MGDEEDRDAILARRNRLIALALAGLGSTIGGCEEAVPAPCLSEAVVERVEAEPEAEAESAERARPGGEPMPLPCLEPQIVETEETEPAARRRRRVRRVPPREATPMPCLSEEIIEPSPPERPGGLAGEARFKKS